jgi:diacylglycerol O-acyltransferase-1
MKYKGNSSDIINFKELIYFFFLPTLCYQLTYPKTSSIRYTWLVKRLV